MAHLDVLITDLAWILIVAALTTILFKWLRQPVVLGYILAGYLVSSQFELLPNVHQLGSINTWAEIGIIFLLFGLGLEFSFRKLMNVGGSALVGAIIVVAGMMFSGFVVGKNMGWDTTDCVFLGGMLSMSSTTIIFKAFNDLGLKGQKFTSVVFGVLVVEDLFAIILMVVLSSIYVGKNVEQVSIGWSIIKLLFFLVLWFGVGIYMIPSLLKKVKRFLNSETLLIVSLGLCLGMVVFASFAGFSAALGAFVMGSILAETIEAKAIEKVTQPIRDLFGAVFFVSVGMLVDPAVLVEYWQPIAIITVVVVLGQITFATLGVLISGQPLKVAIQAGFSLAQIGEFAFIIAALGLSLGVTSSFLYPVAVAVSVVTTFATPMIMRLALPAYAMAERLLPSRLRRILDHLSRGTITASSQSDWRRLINSYLRNMALFSVLLSGIVWILNSYLTPFILESIDGIVGQVVATWVAFLIIAPMIWALTLRRIQPGVYERLWNNSHFNKGLMISLTLIRWLVALFFVMSVIVGVYSYRWGAIVGVGLISLILILFSKRIQRGWQHFESQFRENLDAGSSKVISRLDKYTESVHITTIKVSPECSYAGKTLSELRLRQIYGVTVVSIKRGVKVLNLPQADAQLMPGDELSVVGADRELRDFASRVEFHNQDVVPQKEDNILIKQFWLSGSSPLVGQTLSGSRLRKTLDCMVIWIERANGDIIEPSSPVRFQAGDTVWFAGTKSNIARLTERYK